MKRLMLFALTAGLLLLPVAVFAADYGTKAKDKPPVSQPLVREGDYAVKLVQTLKLGKVTDETKAEDILAEKGIAPKSGWISDFPVTPEIVAQVQTSVGVASDSRKIPLGRQDADKYVVALNSELGLGITVASGKAAESAESAPQYSEPAVINNYYYDEGPPVVTYYAPPPDWWYLYAWDPWPFWCGGFFFPGFFVLVDFDRPVFVSNGVVVFSNTVVIGSRTAIISNHVIDPVTHASVRIDPVSVRPLAKTSFRPIGAKSWTAVASTRGALAGRTATSRGGGFNKTSASHILSHSASISRTTGVHGGSWSGSTNRGASRGTPSVGSRSTSRSMGGSRSLGNSGGSRSFSNSGGGRSFSNSGGSRSFSSAPSGGRSFGNSGGSYGGGRSYGGGSYGGGRSMGGGGRSFGGGGFGGGGCRGGRC